MALKALVPMQRVASLVRTGDLWAILFLVVWPFLYFYPIVLGQGVWFTADIASIYYPAGLELSRALSAGRLPLWTTGVSAGFPLLAEGYVAAFYPINQLLFRFLPAQYAISFNTLLHLAWAGCGMYLYVRSIGFRVSSGLLAGLAFCFNGWMLQKISHTPILMTAAWLPWLIFLQDRFQRAQRDHKASAGVWLGFTALAFAMQWLIGSPQIAVLNTVAFVLWGFFGILFWNSSGTDSGERSPLKIILRAAFWTTLPLVLGIGIAGIQLVPTGELVTFSVRSAAQAEDFHELFAAACFPPSIRCPVFSRTP